jgi:hypothetical protein
MERYNPGWSESHKRERYRLLEEEIKLLKEEIYLLRELIKALGPHYAPTVAITVS